jgi:hypothetical protein
MLDTAHCEGYLVYTVEYHFQGRLLQEEPSTKSKTTDPVMKSISEVMFNQSVDSEEPTRPTSEQLGARSWQLLLQALSAGMSSDGNFWRWAGF